MSQSLFHPGRNCWLTSRVQQAGLLVDGRSYYGAFCEAARQARRYILLAGWQFDTAAQLVRGADATGAPSACTLLGFLNELCDRNPKLRVYILAWDFSVFYTLKREFLQALQFAWDGRPQIQFRYDNSHPLGASHHQKFVVVDGVIAFVGGMDICQGTWDDGQHRATDERRVRSDGSAYPPRHDVQAYVIGRAAGKLARLFRRRWRWAGGTRLWLRRSLHWQPRVSGGLPLAARRVAICRTVGQTLLPRQGSIMEVRQLLIDMIGAADRLIYMEQQYFAAEAVYAALLQRLRAPERPKLQIVIIMPRQPEDFFEEIGLGATQARYLRNVARVAAQTGHALGIYNTRASGENPAGVLTFVHAKLIMVDDRCLTIGSANLSNRSMGFDSELNLAFEAGKRGQLATTIAAARSALLAEHCGITDAAGLERLRQVDGLVGYLDQLAQEPSSRLCHHQIGAIKLGEWVTSLTAHELMVDPQKSVLAEHLYHLIAADENGLFAKGITLMNERLFGERTRKDRGGI